MSVHDLKIDRISGCRCIQMRLSILKKYFILKKWIHPVQHVETVYKKVRLVQHSVVFQTRFKLILFSMACKLFMPERCFA